MYLDVNKIKSEVNIKSILDYYSINLKSNGHNRLSGCCPLHKGDNPNAFQVDLNKNLFHCFTHCGGGSIFDLVMKIENVSFFQAAKKIWDIFYPEKKTNMQKQLQLTLKHEHPYLKKRNINKQLAQYFQTGFCQSGIMKNRIAIPIFDLNKKIAAYCGRALNQNSMPKYLFPKNFNKSKYVFNLQNIMPHTNDPVFIVEGFFDCIHISKLGFDAVAIMGTSISDQQCNLLKNTCRPFILMLDGDKAGQNAIPIITNKMKMAGIEFRTVYLSQNADPELLDYQYLTSTTKKIHFF